MKKNSLTTAVVASLAGIAGIANISNAVNLNPDGLGQVLIYPYYTVEKGNQTLISVVNTTNIGKAVKVRIIEGVNSREVLDFNLYMSPFDVWTAAIFDTKNGPGLPNSNTGPATLITRDNSCTVPTIVGREGSRVDFRNGNYAGDSNDSGSDAIERTREGYIELIEMGSVPRTKFNNATGQFIVPSEPNGTFRASLHSAAGTPPGCDSIVDAWRDRGTGGFFGGTIASGYDGSFGDFLINQNDIAPPSGGLFGGGAIVDTANGSYINYAAEAVDGFSSRTQHTNPTTFEPSLNNVTGATSDANPRSFVFTNGSLVISEWRNAAATGSNGLAPTPQTVPPTFPIPQTGSAIDAVSALFQSEVISNEFTTETGLNGASEWVITFPTKRFYVDDIYGAAYNGSSAAIAPFTQRFNRFTAAGAIVEAGATRSFACETLVFGFRNREEGSPTSINPVDFSPPLSNSIPASSLCFESQVVSFNQAGGATPSKIFGSRLNANLATFNVGWSTFDFSRTGTSSTSPSRAMRRSLATPVGLASGSHVWRGLPSVGFWATSLENNNATANRIANYGGAFTHKRTRGCATVAGGSCAQF